MKINTKFLTVALVAGFITTGAYADNGMSGMHMDDNRKIMMQVQKEKNPDRRYQYMHRHMKNMREMMGVMDDMMVNQGDQERRMEWMTDYQGGQMRGMGMGMDNKDEMGGGQRGGGMMMGGMMQMMGGMMHRNDDMGQRMDMMHEMMNQMLNHMEQLDMK